MLNHVRFENDVQGVEFVVVNTDAQALNLAIADRKFQIGRDLTRGLLPPPPTPTTIILGAYVNSFPNPKPSIPETSSFLLLLFYFFIKYHIENPN